MEEIVNLFHGFAVVIQPFNLLVMLVGIMDSGKPTLVNAVIDPAAGSESGNIGKLNPQSAIRKK